MYYRFVMSKAQALGFAASSTSAFDDNNDVTTCIIRYDRGNVNVFM